MEEIVTVDGKQFKLTIDRPLTATERTSVIADIRKQSCGTCGPRTAQPRTMTAGFANIQSMLTCFEGTKSSGDSVTLSAAPDDAVGPYYVRFWRKSAPGAYAAVAGPFTVAEGSSTSTTITLTDVDLTGAVGDSDATTGAGIPEVNEATGAIIEPGDGTATFGSGILRVATTTIDSCPTGSRGCVEYCDVSLACVAPTCNFVVT